LGGQKELKLEGKLSMTENAKPCGRHFLTMREKKNQLGGGGKIKKSKGKSLGAHSKQTISPQKKK